MFETTGFSLDGQGLSGDSVVGSLFAPHHFLRLTLLSDSSIHTGA